MPERHCQLYRHAGGDPGGKSQGRTGCGLQQVLQQALQCGAMCGHIHHPTGALFVDRGA